MTPRRSPTVSRPTSSTSIPFLYRFDATRRPAPLLRAAARRSPRHVAHGPLGRGCPDRRRRVHVRRATTATTARRSSRPGPDGRIALWREWQHLDDAATWDERLRGPRATDDTDLSAIDHVQLGMPAGGEDAARAFYADVLGLREVAKPPQLAGRGGVWFAARARRHPPRRRTRFPAAPSAHIRPSSSTTSSACGRGCPAGSRYRGRRQRPAGRPVLRPRSVRQSDRARRRRRCRFQRATDSCLTDPRWSVSRRWRTREPGTLPSRGSAAGPRRTASPMAAGRRGRSGARRAGCRHPGSRCGPAAADRRANRR